MNLAQSLPGRPDAVLARRRPHWSSLLGWLVAATLACASSVAIAAIPWSRGVTREWLEFEAAPGIGVPDGTWLEAQPFGYADVHGTARLVLIERAARSRRVAACEVPRAPDGSSYVDLNTLVR